MSFSIKTTAWSLASLVVMGMAAGAYQYRKPEPVQDQTARLTSLPSSLYTTSCTVYELRGDKAIVRHVYSGDDIQGTLAYNDTLRDAENASSRAFTNCALKISYDKEFTKGFAKIEARDLSNSQGLNISIGFALRDDQERATAASMIRGQAYAMDSHRAPKLQASF